MATTEPHLTVVEPEFTADEFLREIKRRKGRIFRVGDFGVFVLTTDEECAQWLLKLGGAAFRPHNLPESAGLGPTKGYKRGGKGGRWEWDIYIHSIPVAGEETIYEAAVRHRTGRPWR